MTAVRAFVCVVLAVGPSLSAQGQDSTGRADSLPIRLSYTGSAWVLGNLNGSVDPFYHASALLHVLVTSHVGDDVEVPMRLLSETWNFSQRYQTTNQIQLRPAIRVILRSRRRSSDSLTLLAGDLWRVRHGEGLMLDDFESRGATLRAYTGRWSLAAQLIGSGWTGIDDLRTGSLEYANRVAIRWLNDITDNSAYVGSRFVSADARIAVPIVGGLFGELARNVDARRWGGLVGLRRQFASGPHRLSASLEYRHYDRNFFRNDDNAAAIYLYFSSLTALDKPIHSFHLYQQRRGRHDVVAARVRGRVYRGSWFVDADLETLGGTVHELAYEGTVGVRVNGWVDLRTGLLHKIFRFPTPQADMFRLRDDPLWFMKATIDLTEAGR